MSETNSEIVWYIARDGQQHGPLTDAEMRLFVQSGHLKPSDLVWNQTMTEWQAAEVVFPESEKQPAPPPPPPPQATSPAADAGDKAKTQVSEAPSSEKETVGSTAEPSRAAASTVKSRNEAKPAEARSFGGGAESTPKQADRPAAESSPKTSSAPGEPTIRQTDYGRAPGQPAGGSSHGSQRLPSPDEVFPSLQQEERQRAQLHSDAMHAETTRHQQPAPVDGEEEDYDDEPRRGRFGLAIGLVAAAAVFVGGGVLALQNKDAIFKYMNEQSDTAANEPPPVIKADKETKTAALDASQSPGNGSVRSDQTPPAQPAPKMPVGPELKGITVTVPPTQPVQPSQSDGAADSVPLQTIDQNLQKSQLWRVVKAEFPQWYEERVKEIAQLSNSASETDLSKHLIGKLVALRRENAKYALASKTEDLQAIAEAFLANLKSLAGHSTEACYTFISKGETSPSVIALFPKPGYGDAIEGQIAAVFRAVASGRKSPVTREKASKADYDALAAELTKLGWSKADLGLFANPQALAKAPPEKVCKMVQDWFTAHVSIPDKGVQDRLLVETLRPVVAG